jgi:ABC-type sugar transport system permease subunit
VVRAKDQAGNLGATTTISLTIKRETTEKETGVTMTNVIGAIMALIIVCLVVLLVFFIGKSSQTDKGPAKPEKTIEKDEEE